MPRTTRQKSPSGIYHIMMRGINREPIFHDDEDRRHFLSLLIHTRLPDAFDLYAYCLMANHVHLLICERSDDISRTMKRINSRYVSWHNAKYDRIGPLFQDRFKSLNIVDDRYLLSVLRYIHLNPVKANLVKSPEDYAWSSCGDFYSATEEPSDLLNLRFILNLFDERSSVAIERLKLFTLQPSTDKIPDYDDCARISDDKLRQKILALLSGKPLLTIQALDRKDRDALLQKIKSIEGATHRQIARVLNLAPNIIFKA